VCTEILNTSPAKRILSVSVSDIRTNFKCGLSRYQQTSGADQGTATATSQVSSTTQASQTNGVTSTTPTIVTAQSQQPQQITLQGANGQQFTVIQNNVPQMSQTMNIPGLGNVQLIPAGQLMQQQAQTITLQQPGNPNTQQLLQAIQQASNPLAGLGNIGGTQHIQQDPNDPTKWQLINQPPLVVTQLPNGGTVTTIKAEIDKPKTRLRRVACTCPNCTDMDSR